MTKKEALNDIIENGINLGAGDYVSLEALKVAAEALQEPEIVHCKDCKHWYKKKLCIAPI